MTADPKTPPALAPETTTYLEMLTLDDLRPSRADADALTVRRLPVSEFATGRQFYQEVGNDYQWIDRLVWSDLVNLR